MKLTVDNHRPLYDIAETISKDHRNNGKSIYFGAEPYLDALSELDRITDWYHYDTAQSVVRYLLSNLTTWRGEVARETKKELNEILKLV